MRAHHAEHALAANADPPALDPIRHGMMSAFGTIAPKVALGVALRHDWGPQYTANTFVNEIKCWGFTDTPAFVGEPECNGCAERFFLSFAAEVAKVDQNDDGVISFEEADVNGFSDGLPNTRLYLPPSAFNRFAVTREINDGLLAPRFAPSERAHVLSGVAAFVNPSVPASVPVDADLR